MLDSLMQDAMAVLFAGAEGDTASPLLASCGAVGADGGVTVGRGQEVINQGTKRGGSNLHSVASVSGRDSSVCFGLVGTAGSITTREILHVINI